MQRQALIAAVIIALAASTAGARPVASVVLRNPTSQPMVNVPVTFGQVFVRGDANQGLAASAPDRDAQVDVKCTWPDGSIRYAIVSMLLPSIPPGATTIQLVTSQPGEQGGPRPSVALDNLLKTDYDTIVTLTFPTSRPDNAPGQVVRSISARRLLEQGQPNVPRWLTGSQAVEWLVSGSPAGPDGQLDQDLVVAFHVRAYAGGRYVRTSVVVENCQDTWAGHIGYDVTIAQAATTRPAFERKGLVHRRLSRWRKDVWWPAPPPQVEVVHDAAYLAASGAVPNYDRSLASQPDDLARAEAALASREFEPMGAGSLTKFMPTTGRRPEIGPYPAWTARYLITMDDRARRLVLANGDVAGSWPIHVRSSKTQRILSLDDRPDFWLNGVRPGEDHPKWQPDRAAPPPGDRWPLTPDVAHQPSLAYVPYLVTGDFYYLEEAYFWANYCLLAQWNVPRGGARGLLVDEVRGNAWALRNLADAASIAPDSNPERAYFAKRVAANLDAMAAKMLGPPEYNAMGFWAIRTAAAAQIDKPANDRWLVIAPWEHDYLIWSLHHLSGLGWPAAAKARDFALRWRVGAFLHPPFDPRRSVAYRMVVGEIGGDGRAAIYTDWAKLDRENRRLNPREQLDRDAGGYAWSARAALVCGVDAAFEGAPVALKTVDQLLGDRRAPLTKNPTFAIVPLTTAPSEQ